MADIRQVTKLTDNGCKKLGLFESARSLGVTRQRIILEIRLAHALGLSLSLFGFASAGTGTFFLVRTQAGKAHLTMIPALFCG